jgi:predicted AAA+ superfamily ATPase
MMLKVGGNNLSGLTAMIDWNTTNAATATYQRPVIQIDPVSLNQLWGIKIQKQRLIINIERFYQLS